MATLAAPEVRKGLPIVAYLVFGVSALVILAVGGVLLVTLSIATRNTFELLEDKGRLLITGIARELQLFLEPAAAEVEAVARLIESGRLDPTNPEQLFRALEAGLAASPHVSAMVYFDPSGWLMAAREGAKVPTPDVADWDRQPAGRRAIEQALARRQRAAYWGAPVYVKNQGITLVNLQRTLLIDGKARGVLVSTITMPTLSEFMTSIETEVGQNAFILYDRDFVLAHSTLALNFPGLGPKRPLPRVTEIGDPVLFGIWGQGWQDRRLHGGCRATGTGSATPAICSSTRASRRRSTRIGWSAAISRSRRSTSSSSVCSWPWVLGLWAWWRRRSRRSGWAAG